MSLAWRRTSDATPQADAQANPFQCTRLEEQRQKSQESQEGQERPARPEILPTKDEAFEKLLAERTKPQTMEEAMAEAVELTKLLQAMQGTTEEGHEVEGYEVGDLGERVSQLALELCGGDRGQDFAGVLIVAASRPVLSAQVSEARLTAWCCGTTGEQWSTWLGPARAMSHAGVQGWAAAPEGPRPRLTVEHPEVAQLHQSSAADWGKSQSDGERCLCAMHGTVPVLSAMRHAGRRG